MSTVSCRIYLFFYEFTSSTTLIYIQYRNFYDTTYLHSCRILYTISSLPFYIFLLSLSTSSSQIHNYTSHRRTNTPEWSLSASRRPQVMAFSPSFTPRWAGSVIASRVPQSNQPLTSDQSIKIDKILLVRFRGSMIWQIMMMTRVDEDNVIYRTLGALSCDKHAVR